MAKAAVADTAAATKRRPLVILINTPRLSGATPQAPIVI
jgi:hypothetical protein